MKAEPPVQEHSIKERDERIIEEIESKIPLQRINNDEDMPIQIETDLSIQEIPQPNFEGIKEINLQEKDNEPSNELLDSAVNMIVKDSKIANSEELTKNDTMSLISLKEALDAQDVLLKGAKEVIVIRQDLLEIIRSLIWKITIKGARWFFSQNSLIIFGDKKEVQSTKDTIEDYIRLLSDGQEQSNQPNFVGIKELNLQEKDNEPSNELLDSAVNTIVKDSKIANSEELIKNDTTSLISLKEALDAQDVFLKGANEVIVIRQDLLEIIRSLIWKIAIKGTRWFFSQSSLIIFGDKKEAQSTKDIIEDYIRLLSDGEEQSNQSRVSHNGNLNDELQRSLQDFDKSDEAKDQDIIPDETDLLHIDGKNPSKPSEIKNTGFENKH